MHKTYEKGKGVTAVLEMYMISVLDLFKICLFARKVQRGPGRQQKINYFACIV